MLRSYPCFPLTECIINRTFQLVFFIISRFNSPQNSLCLPVAFMGAPTIVIEKLFSGTETTDALEGIKKLLASGVCDKTNDSGRKSAGGIEVKESSKYPGVYEAFGLDKIILPQNGNKLPSVCMKYSAKQKYFV